MTLPIIKQVQHPNNLVVGVPQGYAAEQTADGFRLAPEGDYNRRVRYPINIDVALTTNAVDAPDSSFAVKELSGKKIYHRVTQSEGGSGGASYRFEAIEILSNKQIKVSQTLQSENEEPDFAAAWSIVQATGEKTAR